jgi:hypothetical protein
VPLFPGIVNNVLSSFPRLNSEPGEPGAVGDLPLGSVTRHEEMADFISGAGAEVSDGLGKSVDVMALVQATRIKNGRILISKRAGRFIINKCPINEDFTYYDKYTTR